MASRARSWMALTAALLVFMPLSADAARRSHHPARRSHATRSHHARVPRTEEERALLAIQDQGDRRVQALLRATIGWTDPAMLRARDRRVGEIRRATRLQQLQIRAAFARRRGDRAEAAALQREIGQTHRQGA